MISNKLQLITLAMGLLMVVGAVALMNKYLQYANSTVEQAPKCEVSRAFHDDSSKFRAKHLTQGCSELERYNWAEDNCAPGYSVTIADTIRCQPKQP